MNPGTASVLDHLNRRAGVPPASTALVYLDHLGREQSKLSWRELTARSHAIAATLQRLDGRPGCALLMHPPGLDFVTAFLGCLYAGVPAVPVCLPRVSHQRRLFLAVVRESRPALVLSTAAALISERSFLDSVEDLADARRIATDEIETEASRHWRDPELQGDDLAYLQFTSGSAGDPRGVMVSHDNLRWNSYCLSDRFDHSRASLMVSWLPTFHDMGLLYAVLEPVLGGFPCVMMSPWSFLRRPAVWLEAISRYRGTHSAAPNFAFDLCLRRIPEEERRDFKLDSWRVALNAAEPVRWDTMKRFSAAFEEAGFRWSTFNPSYGLAESTVMASGNHVEDSPRRRRPPARGTEGDGRRSSARRAVSVGPPAQGTRALIVEPEDQRALPDGQVGEIWLSGPLVADGYWNRPEETTSTFNATIDGLPGEYLRTGDLGFVAEEELHITGRLKDLIIVAGENHYPQDIEYSVERCHPALRPGSTVAFSIDDAREERLIVVAGVARSKGRSGPEIPASGIEKAIRTAVGREHEVGVHSVVLVPPGEIPRTSSGKVQRRLCRERYREAKLKRLWESPGRGT